LHSVLVDALNWWYLQISQNSTILDHFSIEADGFGDPHFDKHPFNALPGTGHEICLQHQVR
jgi:hypothetical protein